MKRARSWSISAASDLAGFDDLKSHDQAMLNALIAVAAGNLATKHKPKPQKQAKVDSLLGGGTASRKRKADSIAASAGAGAGSGSGSGSGRGGGSSASAPASGGYVRKTGAASGRFRVFTRLCREVETVASKTDKTVALRQCFAKFGGDLVTLVKFLLPREVKRVYNVKEKQLIKVLAPLLGVSTADMEYDAEQGYVQVCWLGAGARLMNHTVHAVTFRKPPPSSSATA